MADASEFVYITDGRRATFDDYVAVMEDRPTKFTAEQCAYSPTPKFTQTCHGCVHLFRSQVSKRITCEVFRPADDNNVSPAGYCAFWTEDYKNFPLLRLLDEED